MEDEFKLLNDLLNIGCCKLCAVRYLCKKQIDFSNVDEYLLEHRFHENVVKTDNEATHNTVIKKIKTNPCVVCLGVITALSNTTSGTFMENYPVPPEIPSKFLQVKDIECKHNSIFFAGRYTKYSRELSQSPWIIDGVKTMETSVQEIIFDSIKKVLGISENNLKFSSSGREDCDVRCLGKGRPFYIEVLDPMKTKISFKEFRQIETEINKTELIGVLHMQNVDRSELTKVKEGEEEKTKDYNALCLTKDPITQEQLDKINNYGKVEILQKTPIRVLHRRPLAIRNKTIYEMKAKPVEGKPNLIDLHLNTQAGTYVKEFVHGDFGRTIPNIGEIIGTDVDIIALDVTAINLDWPTEIEYESNNDIKSSDNNVNDIPNKS
ncbi:hypothetical protein MML48_5g00019231 [Holotrichia oblita]|uniref:Uncharacterized protein n=1 Tax=Holotrichia oblita TaxID=644536 RepID=A0ACB9T4W1_HOLOL|nr:hypothetical protein MML48_5g00019231 [Holotrichia oblita]